MNTEKLPIEDASDEQLRSFATSFLQLELDEKVKTRAQILGAITKAWPQPWIHVAAAPEAPVQAAGVVPTPKVEKLGFKGHYKDDPIVEVTVGTTAYPGGKHPASVSVNGSNNLVIQRNQRVAIPYRFYLALENAHEEHMVQDGVEVVATRITNYPMQVHKLPSDEEIAAWHERTKNVVLG